MKTIRKNRLIDKIMVINNEYLLNAIEHIFSSTQTEDKLTFDSHQIEMLMMSENDIQHRHPFPYADETYH